MYLVGHDLFRKPVPTFRDHALEGRLIWSATRLRLRARAVAPPADVAELVGYSPDRVPAATVRRPSHPSALLHRCLGIHFPPMRARPPADGPSAIPSARRVDQSLPGDRGVRRDRSA